MECRWPPSSFPPLHRWVSIACAASCACVWPPQRAACCLDVGRCVFDLSNWNTNTARTGSGPFFLIYSSKIPRVVELRDCISSTRLTSKYYRTSAIKGLPTPNLCHSLTWGRHPVSLANLSVLILNAPIPSTHAALSLPPLPFPPFCSQPIKGASKGSGKFWGPKPDTNASLPGSLGCTGLK